MNCFTTIWSRKLSSFGTLSARGFRQISSLLRDLGHGEFSYNGSEVAYSFRYGWVQVAEPERPDFIEFISECADDEDEVSLDVLLSAEDILKEAIAARQPDGDEDE